MARVTVEDCIDKVPNRFELVMLAAHRARKLSSGAAPEVDRCAKLPTRRLAPANCANLPFRRCNTRLRWTSRKKTRWRNAWVPKPRMHRKAMI